MKKRRRKLIIPVYLDFSKRLYVKGLCKTGATRYTVFFEVNGGFLNSLKGGFIRSLKGGL